MGSINEIREFDQKSPRAGSETIPLPFCWCQCLQLERKILQFCFPAWGKEIWAALGSLGCAGRAPGNSNFMPGNSNFTLWKFCAGQAEAGHCVGKEPPSLWDLGFGPTWSLPPTRFVLCVPQPLISTWKRGNDDFLQEGNFSHVSVTFRRPIPHHRQWSSPQSFILECEMNWE